MTVMDDAGTITALCVTRRDRVGLCLRATQSFLAQGYPDKRLLVVVEDAAHGRELSDALGDHPGVFHLTPSGYPADVHGRFAAAVRMLGDWKSVYLTFWDDDNESHPDRLARQVAACHPGHPSFLSGALWHYFDSQELFAFEFDERGKDLWTRVVHGSLVCRTADLLGVDVAKAVRKHRNPGNGIGRAVFEKFGDRITRAVGEWWWMKVGVRGDNLSGSDNHRGIVADPKRCFSVRSLRERRVLLDRFLARYAWDEDVDVCGVDGVAFPYAPAERRAGLPPVGAPSGFEKRKEEL